MLLQSSSNEWIDLFHKYINPENISNAIEYNSYFNSIVDALYLCILVLICIRLVISCISAIIKWFKKC